VAAAAAAAGLPGLLQACGGSSPGQSASPPPAQADVSTLYAAAKKEGTLTWWTAQYEQSAAEKLVAAFKAKYPGIEVQLLRQTAQVVYQRLQQNLKAGVAECDVFGSTDEAHFVTLKKANSLATFKAPDGDKLPKQFQNLDPDHAYNQGAFGFVLLNYRSDKVTSPPTTWKGLLEDKWNGKITVGHPGFSGYVGNWVVAMLDKYGDNYLKDLAKLNPKIGRSVNDTVTDIVSGERQVGAGPDNYSLAKKAQGNPIDIKFPTDDAILISAPTGIPSNAPHPNAARLFVNFQYSKEYSQTLAQTYNFPLREDVPYSGGNLGKIKWHRNDSQRLLTGVPDAVRKWREIMGV
jgi:iron(III) transport system substrate-binding protein